MFSSKKFAKCNNKRKSAYNVAKSFMLFNICCELIYVPLSFKFNKQNMQAN